MSTGTTLSIDGENGSKARRFYVLSSWEVTLKGAR